MKNGNEYVNIEISKRAMDSCIACYTNLKEKGLEDSENMFFLIAWIAGLARVTKDDIKLDDNFLNAMKEDLKKWE